MMSLGSVRPGIATVLPAGAALVWCTAAGVSIGIDPILAIEIAAGGVVAMWLVLVGRDLRRAGRVRGRLDGASSAETIEGVTLRVILGGQVEAFALGALRPTVYLGEASIDVLDRDELSAVIHHEDHHRRTFAPLRSAAVEAWLRIVGRSATARSLLRARLAEMEVAADAHAMRRGVHPRSIATALLKVDMHRSWGSAFSGVGDHRIKALLDAAAGRPAARTSPLPYEWLPMLIVVAVTVGCHLGEVPARL